MYYGNYVVAQCNSIALVVCTRRRPSTCETHAVKIMYMHVCDVDVASKNKSVCMHIGGCERFIPLARTTQTRFPDVHFDLRF